MGYLDSSTPPSYSSASSPPSSSTSPRSSRNGSLPEDEPTILDLFDAHARRSAARPFEDGEADFTSSNSDSYDSAGEGVGQVQYARFSGDDGSYSSRVSSRAASPAPPALQWEGYRPELLSYRSVSRNRSRQPSGTTTPTNGFDKEGQFGPDFFQSHHHQTSALLRKLGGSLAPENSPVMGHKKRKPGWWARRAESRRRSHSLPTSSKPSRNRSCLSTFSSALLRQPWVPTQPLTVLFTFLLLACFAASLTTFLVHVLSNDKVPLPWRTYCQVQRPFPHALADSLAPVNVFVGVFSVDAAYERRHMIRTTYARHTKPIDPVTGRPGQNVQVKFILGRPRATHARRIALEMEMFNDVVVLDVKENMNKGKTHEYFKWAAENATVPVNYRKRGAAADEDVGVGFRKADYVVKADDDSLIVLSELERHLRITPREKTYWGYLIRDLFMGGEIYAVSADLVQYIATYKPILQYTIGAEDKRVAKWMRIHPNKSEINWITERCWIYDSPKAGTTYSHGFLFPDEVERIRLEGRRGIPEEERVRRGGELSQSWSTVTGWKEEYETPVKEMTIEEEVEALIEGGGRWDGEWRENGGRGSKAVKMESVVFETDDSRLVDPRIEREELRREPGGDATGVKPGVPDRSAGIPTATRSTRFGKDLFRDPADVEAVRIVKRAFEEEEEGEEEWTEGEIYNLVKPPAPVVREDGDEEAGWSSVDVPSSSSSSQDASSSSSDLSSVNDTPSSSPLDSTSSLDPISSDVDSTPDSPSPSPTDLTPSPSSDPAPENTPTGQVRFPAHNYILPPSLVDRLVPPPTLRYDSTLLSLRHQRMLNKPHGGTVAVHFLKRNEWFYEAALALIGREKMWDSGVEALAFAPLSVIGEEEEAEVSRVPKWDGVGSVESVDPLWGGARMYGSPIVREGGYVSEGREADKRREVVVNVPNSMGGRLGRLRGTPKMGFALEEGEEASVGESEEEEGPRFVQQPAAAL